MTNPTPHGQVPEALRLAHIFDHPLPPEWPDMVAAAAELRRQHARIAELEARVQELGAMARENRSRRIVELEAELEAVSAGGVQALSAAPAEQQAAPKAAPGEQNTVPAEWLEQAYREGWAACRDAETIGEEAEDWAFGNSTANSRMIDAQQAAPQQEVQEPAAFIHWPINGPPRLVWYSQKALNDAILKTHEDGYKPDVKLYTAPQPAPAPLSDDAKDAARWRMAALIGNEVMLHPDKRTHATAVKAYMDATHSGSDLTGAVDAALAAQGGNNAG